MLLTAQEMRAAEERLLADGVSAESLMEEAGRGLAEAVARFSPQVGLAVLVTGKGHNAGDVYVAARHLRERGWSLREWAAFPEERLASLTRRQRDRVKELATFDPEEGVAPGTPVIVLEGLLGIGSRGALRKPIKATVQKLNALSRERGWRVFAIDVPTGLSEQAPLPALAVKASTTLTIGSPKAALLAPGAEDWVGRLEVIPVTGLTELKGADPALLTTPASLRKSWPPRPASWHKGDAGRLGVVGGSPGMAGAALLAAEGGLRAGAGLVTLFAHESVAGELAARARPEIMVQVVRDWRGVLEYRLDALVIGPGLGRLADRSLDPLLSDLTLPVLIDADGLNRLAKTNLFPLQQARGPRLLTPHPGEMARLWPDASDVPPRQQAEAFAGEYQVTLLLKGARSVVASAEGQTGYNSTGHPGMATGGMGDVLSGVAGAYLALGTEPFQAASRAAWLCGRAAELAWERGGQSMASVLASDVLAWLGRAERELWQGGR
ncbi:MAG: NAD(P)H-hydrate dehydratase [Verrucomicrobiota bacterium]